MHVELEIAGLFAKNEEQQYDGFIGRGSLALIKTFNDWAKDDPGRMMVSPGYSIHQKVFLFPPTDDPDEWEETVVVFDRRLSAMVQHVLHYS